MKIRGNKLLRIADIFCGRLILFLLYLFKRRRPFPEHIESIGIFKLTGIGDLTLLTGVIQDTKKTYPNAKIILFCGVDYSQFAPLIPDIDEFILIHPKKPWSALRLLRGKTMTLFIDFGQWSRFEAILSFLAKSLYTIGFKTEGQNRHFLYDSTLSHRNDIHEIDNFRSLALKAKIHSTSPPTCRLKSETLTQELQEILHDKFVIFHAWPSGLKSHLKEWPYAKWIELGTILIQQGYRILISGSKADWEKSCILENGLKEKCMNIAGKVSLNQLGHLISHARCVISVNTGIMHFSTCFNTPLIALHGPTAIKRWGPVSTNSIALGPEQGACQYLNLGFEYPKNPPRCMEEISIEKVMLAFKSTESLG